MDTIKPLADNAENANIILSTKTSAKSAARDASNPEDEELKKNLLNLRDLREKKEIS